MDSLDATGDAGLFKGNASLGLLNLGAQLGLVGTVIALGVVLVVVVGAFAAFAYFSGQHRA